MKLLADVGSRCLSVERVLLRDLDLRRVECDEMWSFVYAKQKNLERNYKNEGTMWTWIAMDADSKLIVAWYLGKRTLADAKRFIRRLEKRLLDPRSVEFATDAYGAYGFANHIISKRETTGIERQNLTIRTSVKRYARKTNGFSKRKKYHRYMLALWFMYYNFCRPHMSLRGDTPAMASGIAGKPFNSTDLCLI